MLSSVMPGLRHIRAPLIAGWLYLACVWLVLGPERLIPDEDAGGFLGRLRALSVEVGPTGTIAAASLLAYLVGNFLVIRRWPVRGDAYVIESDVSGLIDGKTTLWRKLRNRLTISPTILRVHRDDMTHPRFERGLAWWAAAGETWAGDVAERFADRLTYADLAALLTPSSSFLRNLRVAWMEHRQSIWDIANDQMADLNTLNGTSGVNYEIAEHFWESEVPPWEPVDGAWPYAPEHPWWDLSDNLDEPLSRIPVREALVSSMDEEIDLVTSRLRVEGSSLYDEFDRKRSEAELRYTLTPPIVLLAAIGAISWTPWFAVLALAPVGLLRQAYLIERSAISDLLTALLAGVVRSTTVQAMETAARSDS